MDQDNDEIMEDDIMEDDIKEEKESVGANAFLGKLPTTRVQVDVFQYSGGSCIMSWNDVMLNRPPIVGGALNFMYQGRWYMITGTFRVVFEEINLDS